MLAWPETSSCICAKNNSCSVASLFEAKFCFGHRRDFAWHVRADIYHLSNSTRCAQATSVNGHLQEGRMWTEVIKICLIWQRYSYYPQQILSCHLIPSFSLTSSVLSQLLFFPRHVSLSLSHHSYTSITCSLERGWWSDGPLWLCSKNNRANFPPVRWRFHTNLSCTAQLGLSEREGEIKWKRKAGKDKCRSECNVSETDTFFIP